jgi:protein-L-isoaspartate(D-aspartate) O-methyltransferase
MNDLQAHGFIKTPEVRKAMESVSREIFMPGGHEKHAYADEPFPIGRGQTISAPHAVAVMTELIEPKKTDKILEIGTGSGYQTAILSKLVKVVYSLEVDPFLAKDAKKNLAAIGAKNVEVIVADGHKGYQKKAPYDKIIVTCAVPRNLLLKLAGQLKKTGGIMVAPVGIGDVQELTVGKKKGNDINMIFVGQYRFVPIRHSGHA